MKHGPATIYRAAAVRDAAGVESRPGAVAVRDGQVLAAGHPDKLPPRAIRHAHTIELPDHLIVPALVNAHVHLDLSDLGPRPYGGDFVGWLRGVIRERPADPDAVAHAVAQGLRWSAEAGVGWVGDIAGSVHAITARQRLAAEHRVAGVSYLECFGHGEAARDHFAQTTAALDEMRFETPVPGLPRGVVLGFAPHAPYSTGRAVYEAASRLSASRFYRLTTHLAESPEELRFVAHADGPFADLLRELGKWDDAITATGEHPIDVLRPELRRARWLLAHCNYVEDDHFDLLKHAGASVVFCPGASAYFGHRGHRYREMLEAGVNVCLGTDSRACEHGLTDAWQPMSVLAQMRLLYRRDGADPGLLLKMATVNGATALEFRSVDATLGAGAAASLAAVRIDRGDPADPLVQALESDEPMRPVEAAASGV